MSLISELATGLESFLPEDKSKKFWKSAKQLASKIAKKIASGAIRIFVSEGLDASELVEKELSKIITTLMDAYQKDKIAIEEFRNDLNEVVTSLKNENVRLPLVIMVD